MGCYSFKDLKELGIFGKSAYKKVKASSGAAVDQCLQMACENDYEIIGIQKIGRNIFCRKGNERQWKPNATTLNPKKCEANVGSRKSIFVYRQNQGIKYSILTIYACMHAQCPYAWLVSRACLRVERSWFEPWPLRNIVQCSLARHFTLTVPLSTPVHKWVLASLNLGPG